MTNALYKVTPGQAQPPLASDINQLVDLLNGLVDAGMIQFASPISAPSNAGITAAAATGTALGIGAYRYQFTYVVGVKKSDNTVTLGGETLPSTAVTVTTTTGNQAANLGGLPTSWPTTVVALRIYRTAVGGADGTQKLVATIITPVATYTDTTADGALGAAVPTTNTTGTKLGGNVQTTHNTLDDSTGAALIFGQLTYQGNVMPQLRYTNGFIEWYDTVAAAWKGVGGVKSVQRGSVSLIAGSNSISVTITSVNMAKAFVTFNNLFTAQQASGPAQYVVSAFLSNATTLVVSGSVLNSTTAYWEVAESY